MANVYIISENGKLFKQDETLVFLHTDETKTILFPYKTSELILIGKVTITGDAIRLLARYKIPVLILLRNGKFQGKLTFGESKNVFLRQKQYAILTDEKKQVAIAKSIVIGKIKNSLSFMQRIKRKTNYSDADEKLAETAVSKVKEILLHAERVEKIDELRGYEGEAAQIYFSVFGMNIYPAWAEFKTRSKNPPRSNVNAVLSFLYTLVMYRVEAALQGQGLDVCCGNLHALNYGKSALVFDLMEEFRAPLADTLCASLFNLNMLQENDFETKNVFSETDEARDENLSDEKAIVLTKQGLKKTIAAFEEKMDTLIFYAPREEKLSYNKIIFEQAEQYKRVMLGEETEYKPFYFK